jgi:hypothetical protein
MDDATFRERLTALNNEIADVDRTIRLCEHLDTPTERLTAYIEGLAKARGLMTGRDEPEPPPGW